MTIESPQDRLELDSGLTELARVQPWIEALAILYELPAGTRYAIQLCTEEALANVVMHGYRNEPGHPIIIQSSVSGSTLVFVIEDKAPPFDPTDHRSRANASKPVSLDSLQPGGNGLRLLYHFAGSVAYERLSEGNRLTLGFPLGSREVAS